MLFNKLSMFWQFSNVTYIQGTTQKFLVNYYKTRITSYKGIIYFYYSKYTHPLSINLFAVP
jgi:hypothetical protein